MIPDIERFLLGCDETYSSQMNPEAPLLEEEEEEEDDEEVGALGSTRLTQDGGDDLEGINDKVIYKFIIR